METKFLGSMIVQPFEFEFYTDKTITVYNCDSTELVLTMTMQELESVLQRGKQLLKYRAALGEVSKEV